MRRLDINLKQSVFQIRAYEPGRIIVNEQTFHESIIITQKEILAWHVPTIEFLTIELLKPVLALQSDILLVGTGAKHHLIQTIFPDLLNNKGGVEVMSTSAACRTFNALILEERSVVAALIIS